VPGTGKILQFKVTLREIDPPIWRRIQVPAAYTFWDLHVAMQDAMGWTDSHLHEFCVGDPADRAAPRIGIPNDDAFEGDPETLPGWQVPVLEHLREPGDRVAYEYDFGDGWEHEVVLEEILPRASAGKYPRCIAGERACPPEDCGGVPGYESLLEALRDPDHEQHEEFVEWLGGAYDPAAFDARKVRFDDPKKRWRIAFAHAGI
jgi:hypothetical protein